MLAKGREKSLLRRHPWVFSGAVARMEGKASLGETIDIVDHQGKWLARGAYSPASQIRARVWTFDPSESIDIAFFTRRLQQAQKWRDWLAQKDGLDSYRLIAGESDGLPGITIDRFGNFLVLQLLSIVGLLRSVGNPIGSLLMAKARVDISFKFNVFKTFLFIPAIIIGGQMAGAIGVTLGFLLVQIINTILSYFVMIKPVLGSSYRQYILSLWLPFYLSLPTLVVSYALGIVLKGQLALGMLLAVQIATGVLAFVVMIVLSRHPLVVEVKRQFCRSEKMKMLLRAG